MWDLLTSVVRVSRKTALVLESTPAAATMSLTRQPAREALLEVHISGAGAPCTGTVYVQGLDGAGVTRSEALAFTEAGYRRTVYRYASAVGLTSSGLSDESPVPAVEVRAVSGSGSPEVAEYDLRTGWPAAIAPGLPSWPNSAGNGTVEAGLAGVVLAYDETWAPRPGDVVHDDTGASWEIVGTPQLASALVASHWSCRAKRREIDT